MSAAKYLLPVAALGAIAYAVGSKKTKKGTSRTEPVPPEPPLPESDRMLFDDGCNDLIVRVRSSSYDVRITDRYWQLRSEGYSDPADLAVGILSMDAPQCTWPPTAESSLRAKRVWDLVYPAVDIYRQMEAAGTLGDYDPIFGTTEEFIE